MTRFSMEQITENEKIYDVRVYDNGDRIWYWYDLLHRENGPAVELCVKEIKAWYLDGIEFTEVDYWKEIAQRQRKNSLDGETIEIEGVKYRLTKIS